MKYAKAAELLKQAYGIVEESFLNSKAKVIELATILSEKWTPNWSPLPTTKHVSSAVSTLLPFADDSKGGTLNPA